ncbi:hypothetical protein HAX54_042388 [Datura stramonium]|uniref:C2H2-type domain-containing protein n=1 Tax=Datura stramonium TaxID=4076 RepID=A0ABS8W3Z4_DATST|nr:hypothetical protein [Datura stramonium]
MVNTQMLFPMVDNQEHQPQSIINGQQQGSPGVRGTGTLWINLKIPKEEEVKEDHNYDQHIFGFENEDEGPIEKKIKHNNSCSRICHVCNKGFSSGKALGGHMRIHVPAANEEFISGKKRKKLNQPIAWYKKRKVEKQEEEKETQEVDILKKDIYNEPPIICSVCGKNFPSMKSLFGHMRCHPDRDWRGIQPPPNNNNNKNMSDRQKHSATASVDLSKTVGGWSVTAKRGRSRKPIIDYSPSYKTSGAKKMTVDETQLRIKGTNIFQMKRIKRRGRKMMKLKDLRSVQHHASNNPVPHHNTLFSTPEKYNKFNIPIQNYSVEEAAKLLVESTNECNNFSITNNDKPQQSSSSSQATSVIRNTSGARILDFDLNELPLIPEDY